MDPYAHQLAEIKARYPFRRWQESGLDQYTPEACAACAEVFDGLIENLSTLGEQAPEAKKLECFRAAVAQLNALNEDDPCLIETGEREDLCELCNVVAVAAGLDPAKYGGGEGPASEWRDW
jgi:hypothetical protein